MIRIPTKTLISLLIASVTVSRSPTLGSSNLIEKKDARLTRLLHKHDRKGELQAALLNVDPADLPVLLKKHTFQELAHQKGFSDMKSFRYALHGKIKDELRARGWSASRIQARISKKIKNIE